MSTQRETMGHYGMWLIRHAPQIHYAAVRPMPTRDLTYARAAQIFADGGTITDDCSGTCTLICKWSGLKPPSAYSYASGAGNSSSMYDHLPKLGSPGDLKVGDLVIYGPDHHVTMVMQPGSDPMLFSHGSEAGPLYISLSSESSAHVGQDVYYVSVAPILTEDPHPVYKVLEHKKRKLNGASYRTGITEYGRLLTYDQRKVAKKNTDVVQHDCRLLANRIWAVVHTPKVGRKAAVGSKLAKQRFARYHRDERFKALYTAAEGTRKP